MKLACTILQIERKNTSGCVAKYAKDMQLVSLCALKGLCFAVQLQLLLRIIMTSFVVQGLL